MPRAEHPSLPLGYHDIRLDWMQDPQIECFAEARLIVCPRRAFAPEGRMAGVALSLYGLRSSRNWGCGDFTDLRAVVDAFAEAGADFIALNPLHAIPNRQPYNTSPYLPQSSLYRNFIYLDVEKIGAVQVGGAGFDALPKFDALRKSEFVEYEPVAKLKLRHPSWRTPHQLSGKRWGIRTRASRVRLKYVEPEARSGSATRSPSTPLLIRPCIKLIQMSGCGPSGPKSTAIHTRKV